MKILVTGGTGYIGSHTAVELINAGHEVVIIDNLSNSREEVLDRIEAITGTRPGFCHMDLRDAGLEGVITGSGIEAVIHFAGSKAVGESVVKPLAYFDNNVSGTLALLRAMESAGVHRLIFSSSATVYGLSGEMPLTESDPLSPQSPYARSKLMIEQILTDLAASNDCWNLSALRYFNPVGAHPSGQIGEDPRGIPANLFPYLTQVAAGRLERLSVFGNDYPTVDGTGVRDYVHVVDLALGHLAALERPHETGRLFVCNLGTGTGSSVLEVMRVFEKVNGLEIPYEFGPRRPGDVTESYCDTSRARSELGWVAHRSIEDMCRDAWRWQQLNPLDFDS